VAETKRLTKDRAMRLADLTSALQAALPSRHAPATTRTDDRETLDLVRNIVSGEEYHPSLTPLAMRMAVRHIPQDMTLALLKGMMHGSGSAADPRWASRYDSLPNIVGSAYAKTDFNPVGDDNWKLALATNERGIVITDWQNVFRALTTAPRLKGSVRFNLRGGYPEVSRALPWATGQTLPRRWTDADAVYLCVWLNAQGFNRVHASMARGVIEAVAHANQYDPVLEYLKSLTWDGVPRVDSWLVRYCGAVADTPDLVKYTTEVGSRWLLQAAARVLHPGCKADCVIILEGRQGIRKSTALKILAGPWFAELVADLTHVDKDVLMAISESWIMEIAEMHSMRRAAVEKAKIFFSQTSDKFRKPYERNVEDHPRATVFAGTMNPDGSDYLQDTTGNRRFWPVALTDTDIDTKALQADRDQIWAEATARVIRGETTFINQHGILRVVELEQSKRETQDPWFDDVESWVETQKDKKSIKIREVLTQALLIPTRECDTAKQVRVARILVRLKMKKHHTENGNVWIWPG
jgi:putative DNA primase/helicase